MFTLKSTCEPCLQNCKRCRCWTRYVLLDVCKTTNILIVNGRLFHDRGVGQWTCTYNGESTVDYFLLSIKNFRYLTDFKVHKFKETLNRALVTFSMSTNSSFTNGTISQGICFKCESENAYYVLHDIIYGVQELEHIVQLGVHSRVQDNISTHVYMYHC